LSPKDSEVGIYSLEISHNYLKHQGARSLFKPTEINGQHGVTPHVFTAVNRIQMAPDIQRSSQPMVMEHVDGKSSTTCTFFVMSDSGMVFLITGF
jgi:hypothetical protein